MYFLLPQRASLKRASKAANLICAVGQFFKCCQAHCIVVMRSSVYSSTHHHNAMRMQMGEPSWISSITSYKDICSGFQIVNNRNHLLCCRKLKAECKHYRVHYICYYTNEILDVSSADYIFRNNKCFKNVFFKARCTVLYQSLMEARKTVSQNTYSFYC